ncbi:MAG: hypothetical protein OSB43_12720 [Nocardioides sp.]|uniref:hypothetical protein n=1 Tax=Nocardioides sp. TaxID=35761 RepID=UPI00238774B5|nr:hypothetical protein [Nocardioides sp.]MDE0777128.1 hypothetical protein [Nocardioides sp.]
MQSKSTGRSGQETSGVREWSRGRLITILTGAVVVALALLVGLGYAIYLAVSGLDGDSSAGDVATGETEHSTVARGASHRDEIAAEPMLSVPPSAAFPDDPDDPDGNWDAGAEQDSIKIPTGTGINGPGLVMTGFPHTPEGAIGQLAQIDTAVLQSMSLQTAQEVYASWALPGGVGAEDWWITSSVEAFLGSSEMGSVKSATASVAVEPAAALVKGTDGPDWATVCVLLKVTATYRSEGHAAFGHCERMQWVGGRWMLAPGVPPAPAPATWSGTELAVEAGWRTWTTDPSTGIPGEHGDDHGEEHSDEQGGAHS